MTQIESPWCKIPLQVLGDPQLTAGDLRVYGILDYMAGKRGWFYDDQAKIAEAAGVSLPTCQRAIEKLRERDYISTVRLGLKNNRVLRYYLHARTTDADAAVAIEEHRARIYPPTDDVTETSSLIEPENITDDASYSTDLPQTETTDLKKRGRVFVLYESLGWTISPAITPTLEALDEEYDVAWLEDAFRLAAEARARNVRYIEVTLKHWKDHGRDCDCTKPKARTNGTAGGSLSAEARREFAAFAPDADG